MNQLLVQALWAYLHTFQYGLHISALNGLQAPLTCEVRTGSLSYLKPCLAMTPSYFGIVVSIFTLGGLIGSLSSDVLSRGIGRVRSLQLSAGLVILGSGCVGLANLPDVMILGRILIGLGCGLATVLTPLYLSALLPAQKSILGILNQLSIVFGLLLGQSLALPFAKPGSWRWVMAFGVGIGLVQLVGGFFIGKEKVIERSAVEEGEEQRLLGSGDEVKEMSLKEVVLSKEPLIRRGFIIVVVTQIAQQLCGVSPVMYFSTRILTPVFKANARYIALVIVLVKIPTTLIPVFLVKRIGSKRILLFSCLGMSLSSLLLAIGINASLQPLSIIGVLGFVSSFSTGLGPVTWAVLSEVLPPQARTGAGSVGLGLNWMMNFLMGSSFLPLQQVLAVGGREGNVFFVFVGTCLAALLAIRYSYKALEAMQE